MKNGLFQPLRWSMLAALFWVGSPLPADGDRGPKQDLAPVLEGLYSPGEWICYCRASSARTKLLVEDLIAKGARPIKEAEGESSAVYSLASIGIKPKAPLRVLKFGDFGAEKMSYGDAPASAIPLEKDALAIFWEEKPFKRAPEKLRSFANRLGAERGYWSQRNGAVFGLLGSGEGLGPVDRGTCGFENCAMEYAVWGEPLVAKSFRHLAVGAHGGICGAHSDWPWYVYRFVPLQNAWLLHLVRYNREMDGDAPEYDISAFVLLDEKGPRLVCPEWPVEGFE